MIRYYIKDDLKKRLDGKRLEMSQYEFCNLLENGDIILWGNG
jgi:hypothetical protein